MDRFPKKPCPHCGSRGHFAWKCTKNPKNKVKRNAIKKRGKYAKQWEKTRATWIRNNPPPIDGEYWECYLQISERCPRLLTIKTLTIDHVVARTRDPSKRFTASNLKPACWFCNDKKGSRSVAEVKGEVL